MGSSLQRGRKQWSEVCPGIPLTVPSLNLQPEQLRGSKFDTPEVLTAFSQKFDEGVRRVFSNDRATQYVKFGTPRDSDPKYGIKAGRLALTG